jgi:hypothetical protein
MTPTLLDRCIEAWADEHAFTVLTVERRRLIGRGIRAVIIHLAAELTIAGEHDAARLLLVQLAAQVIPLRPEPDDAA